MSQKARALLITFIVLFIIGGISVLMGTLFKLQHWSGSSLLLTVGYTVESIALIILGRFLFIQLTGRG